MNLLRARYFSAGLLAALLCVAAAPARANAAGIDWAGFLGHHDLVWDRLPTSWGESAFIGNGSLGATIALESDNTWGWVINRADVYHDGSRFPIGRIALKSAGKITGGDLRLALWPAEATGTLYTDKGEIHWRSFTATTPAVLAIALDGAGGETDCDLVWIPAEARPPSKIARHQSLDPEDLHPAPVIKHTEHALTSVQFFLGGDAHAESIRRVDGPGHQKTFFVSIGFAHAGDAALAEAEAATGAAAQAGLAQVAADHQAEWHRYYAESFVSFPDPQLESYYWIQIYKLRAAMRADGPVLDLMGPWYRATPWSRIWWNLNIQLTYSPLFTANRLELGESLFTALDRGREALIHNVPAEWQNQAAAIGRSSGIDLVRPVDIRHAKSDAGFEMGDLPWTVFYFWEYYRYQMNDAILRDRVYPLLRLAIGHYLAYVKKESDGKWHLPKTLSPELVVVEDANYDLALLRWGLETLIASAEHLKIDDPLLPRWRDVLTNLTPFPRDDSGLMVGKNRPWKESHRHYSHLLSIFPLALTTPDAPDNRALIERSLQTWERDTKAFRGYSFTGGASMHAMLGDGETAVTRLHQFLDFQKYNQPNTLYAEAGPVIETPLSAATSVQDLFLQSWDGKLRVFPAIPAKWTSASFSHLRGEGAFLVSAVRENSKTAWVKIESLAGEPCEVIVPDWTTAVVRDASSNAVKLTADGHGHFTLTLAKGAAVTLAPDTQSALPEIAPVPFAAGDHHFYPDFKFSPKKL